MASGFWTDLGGVVMTPAKRRNRHRKRVTEERSSAITAYDVYISRVGALAVALGVGGAVATNPGVAWADEPSSVSSGSAASESDPDPSPSASDPSSASTVPNSSSDGSTSTPSSDSTDEPDGLTV